MKAAFLKGGRAQLKDVTLRAPGADEVRLRVDACGICGSDLSGNPDADARERPVGHEVAGTILEAGPAAGAGLDPGTRVVLESSSACGRCDRCRDARPDLCTDKRMFFGEPVLGLAEEMVAPGASAIPCDDLPPEVACLQEPLGVAIDLVRVAGVEPDENVLVMGQGPIGLMAAALARHRGARRVLTSDFRRRTGRVKAAERIGVDDFLDPDERPLEDIDFGFAIDRILVTSPPPTLATAFAVAAEGATVAFIGIGHGAAARCTFDANAFHFRKLTLRSSYATPGLFGPMALDLLRRGVIDGPSLITHRFPLSGVAEAFDAARRDPEAVKVVVLPHAS